MVVHPTKSLIVIFEDMFPQYKNDLNKYFDHGVNGIKIITPMAPPLIFRYESKSIWEFTTLERDEEYYQKLIDQRKALDVAQKQIANLKRRKVK